MGGHAARRDNRTEAVEKLNLERRQRIAKETKKKPAPPKTGKKSPR